MQDIAHLAHCALDTEHVGIVVAGHAYRVERALCGGAARRRHGDGPAYGKSAQPLVGADDHSSVIGSTEVDFLDLARRIAFILHTADKAST